MSALDDILAKQKLAEDAYYQAGSPSSGPLYDAYIAALNAGEQASNQVIYGRPDAPRYAEPVPINDPETGKYLGTVPQPGGLKQIGYQQIDKAPAPVSPTTDPQAGAGEQVAKPVPASDVQTSAKPISPTSAVGYGDEPAETGDQYTTDSKGNTFKNGSLYRAAEVDDETGQPLNQTQSEVSSQVVQTQNQETNQSLSQQMPANTDWRVTLRLAPNANYLYKAADAGLLQPLKVTNGVIFPYTPSITTAYKANYSNYDLTHSNYRGYFYQNSYTDVVNLNAQFTAQSTADAAYVLAVIHFFRSVTKMFYGQDTTYRGSPPPLVFLSGLGDYQFNNHPCLVQSFNYILPADVDYISSGSPNNLGLNLQPLQNLYSTTLNAVSPTVTRLATAFLPPGAQNALPAPLQSLLSNPTYVPSKLEIQLTLLPVQSRSQVSKQFSLKGFANGNLLKGGFW